MNSPTVRLKLFGEFQAWIGDRLVELRLKRARLLLAYLALAPSGRASREELVALLWSERGEAQGRQSLRQTIAVSRRAFSTPELDILRSDPETVSIDLKAVETDAVTFKQLVRENSEKNFEHAAALYTGEFLAGLIVRDPLAEDWLSERRAELQSLLLRCLGSALADCTRLERHESVERVASRILAIDPLDEEAHRALMTVHLAQGRPSLAFRQLQRCRKSLLRDLSVTPAPETEALIRLPAGRQPARVGAVQQAAGVNDRQAPRGPSAHGRAADILLPVQKARDHARTRAPSLIVAPFEVLGDGARADLLAYGLVDDIVVDLSRFSTLFVVPPGPVAELNLRPVDPVHVGSTLEIRYVLTGSVQESDERVRVTAMLLDAENGRALWAERYDRQLTDFFEVRDDLARRIAIAASNSAETADYGRLQQRDTKHFGAWELCTLAQRKFLAYTSEHNAEARALFSRALELDPGYARAQVGLGWTHVEDFCFRWSSDPQHSLQQGHQLACQAEASEPRHYKVRYLLSYIQYFRRQLGEAVEECVRARADNPNDPELLFHEGFMMACSGHAESGFNRAEEALCLNPCHADWFHFIYGIVALEAGRYETSLAALSRYIDLTSGPFVGLKASALRFRVAANALSGRLNAARRDASGFLTLDPNFRVNAYTRSLARKDPASIERMTAALRSAGLPA